MFVQEVMDKCKVSKRQALEIISFIDCWLDIDWSEATNRKVNSTIKTAVEMMADERYAEMTSIARSQVKVGA